MKVYIKDFGIDMEVKNRGIEIDICDTSDKHLGDLIISKSKLIWCKGKTSKENGKEITWADFMAYMDTL